MDHSIRSPFRPLHAIGLALAFAALLGGQHLASAQATAAGTALAQNPLFVAESQPPLNMLVMGRDHKMYYEAYNDASDLDGDGVIDVGYKPDRIDYYGYFNNNACYTYSNDVFTPAAVATGAKKKICAGATHWSGDFLNYLTTSRMDAMRRVLYGGARVVDTATSTVLQGSYIPRDAHSWGKAYDPARDLSTYNIQDYAPLAQPASNTRHLFAVTTTDQSGDGAIPRLRVLNDSRFQIWEWVSKEQPVAQDKCIDNGTNCEQPASSEFTMLTSGALQDLTIRTWKWSGSIPGNATEMAARFNTSAVNGNLCGSGTVSVINTTGPNNNPFVPGANSCTHDNYITQIDGKVYIPAVGNYVFAIDGDDAVELSLNGTTLGWYGGHGNNRSQAGLDSHSTTIYFSTAGWHTLRFRHVEAGGDDNWGLALKASYPQSSITDRKIRVEACASSEEALRDASCKSYPNNGGTPIYKPTGLLHDFGENEKMYFGLLTGSYQKNIAGGVLRRNMSKFTEEVDLQTGQFKSDVNGVVANIDRQRAIGFNGSTYNACGWITDGPISGKTDPSICAMWGNPVAEMMFETLRYFAGASGPHSAYDYGNGNSKDKDDLQLSKPEWVSPYDANGGNYQRCSRPVMTVLSDINPSYDFKLPGSRYSTLSDTTLNDFNVSTEVDAIGAAEGIHGKSFFIGQSTQDNADAAPTVKQVNSLSWVRGLSPNEPSKEGTYYSAGVARFAANNARFGTSASNGKNPLMTYAVAIASPLPEIRFPVNAARDHFVTIAPFAKSVTGSNIDNTKFAPTNQIVDYYVDRIANTGTTDQDASVNGGRPYAVFRINYEDVEQGADHDMDAIARYTVALQANGTVKIDMVSEYAAGGIGQHMGYVISGTTQDGMYLEVRDRDTASVYYALNTPAGEAPGYCANRASETKCAELGLNASRTFTPSATGSTSGSFLKDPLWYAAKYGMPDRNPASVNGDPDNYFLVTNATTLKDRLSRAFNDILQRNNSVTAVSLNLPAGNFTAGADIFRTAFVADGWTGDVIRESLTEQADGSIVRDTKWRAAEKLAARTAASRKILYAGAGTATPTLREFKLDGDNLQQSADAAWLTALNRNAAGAVDNQAAERIKFLRGDDSTLRTRKTSNKLGDIVNSALAYVKGAAYRTAVADTLEKSTKYAAFATSQAAQPEMVYVGANDGMLHAFNAGTGEEVFAFIPTAVRDTLSILTASNYGEKEGTPHRYYVDGSPTVADVYFDGDWHKVLLGSLGAGGREVFALDITDPAAPKLLWEFVGVTGGNPDMGYSVPQPVIARLNNGKWAALIANGYQAGNATQGGGKATLFVLDMADGSLIKRFDMDGGWTAAELLAAGAMGNGLGRVAGIDDDRDGTVDLAYAGDLAGNVWRFDMRGDAPSAWGVKKLYTAKDAAGKRQPVTAMPYVVDHPTGKGDIVIVGTGSLMTDADKASKQQQTVYGIWDRYAGETDALPTNLPTAGKARADLVAQSFTALDENGNFGLSQNKVAWYKSSATTHTDADVDKWGWYVNLPHAGEKIVFDMKLYGKGLFLTSIEMSEDVCAAGLSSTLYVVDPNQGGQTDYTVFDINRDGVFSAADNIAQTRVSGTKGGAGGQQSIGGGWVIGPTGERDIRINPGVEIGRQSWRRQPPNPPAP